MGKTLVSILEVGTEIAATVFLTPLIGPVGAALVGGALVAAENGLAKPRSQKPGLTEAALKSPTPARISAYGAARRRGAFMLETGA